MNDRTSKTDLIQYLRVCADLAGQKGGDGLAYVSPVALRRAIELLDAVETPERREKAWLVESGAAAPNTEYRYMDQMGFHWTKDINKAIRFARREDAEMAAAGDEDAWSIVEHEWVTLGSPLEPSRCIHGECLNEATREGIKKFGEPILPPGPCPGDGCKGCAECWTTDSAPPESESRE